MTVFCVNCKWHCLGMSYEGTTHKCLHPTSVEEKVNVVTGEVIKYSWSCDTMRGPSAERSGLCGPQAKDFQPKEDN